MIIDDTYEGTQIKSSLSTIVGNVITVSTRKTYAHGSTTIKNFGHGMTKVDDVLGLDPLVKVPLNNAHWPYTVNTKRGVMSKDGGRTWQYVNTSLATPGYVTWQYGQPLDVDSVIFAQRRVALPTHIKEYTTALIAANPTRLTRVPVPLYSPQTDERGVVWSGYGADAFWIRNPTLQPASGEPKENLVITADIHAGESIGGLVGRGLVNLLLTNDPVADLILGNMNVLVVWNWNAVGRAAGHHRAQFQVGQPGNLRDGNRCFNTTGLLEVVDIPRAVILTQTLGLARALIDLHGFTSSGVYVGPYAPLDGTLLTKLRGYYPAYTDNGQQVVGMCSWFGYTSLGADPSSTVETDEHNTEYTDPEIALIGENVARAVSQTLNLPAPIPGEPEDPVEDPPPEDPPPVPPIDERVTIIEQRLNNAGIP